ncbi:MAG: FKBP-type peptidyl-prolyl cis-trans isomerase [Gammaproteobacteria bacterium]
MHKDPKGTYTVKYTLQASFIFLVAATLFLATASVFAADYKSDKEKYSYAIGFQIGNNLKREDADIDIDAIAQGIKDVISGADLKVNMEDMQAAVMKVQKEQQAKRQAKGESAKKEGAEFLAKNKKEKGVKELDNGIQYKILKKGDGAQPKPTDTIVAHYKGTLIDGKEFDSSYKRGQPATFAVNQVIQGWQEILPMMHTGSKWKVFIPSDLAYGERGAGANIGPNETLIFEIELLDIKK